MCSESSPRISFSSYLIEQQHSVIQHHLRKDRNLLHSNSDFEFSSLRHQSSSADELFADGLILPALHFPETNQPHTRRNVSLPPLPCNSVRENTVLEEKNQSKSIRGFKRSSSINSYTNNTSICSSQLLSRSNSTGSEKPSAYYKQKKQQLGKKVTGSYAQKPPLKKYNPVLNVPPPYIAQGAAAFFGFGSFLRYGKHKNTR